MTRVEVDVHDLVRDLVEPHEHRSGYESQDAAGTTWMLAHRVRVPSLIDQLLLDDPPGSGASAGSVPHSRPLARVERLDTVMLIDDEAGRWVERLGENRPVDSWDHRRQVRVMGSGTKAAVRRLHALYPATPVCRRPHGRRSLAGEWCCVRHRIEYDVRRWWHQARVISGWDSPSFRPFNTCPVCEHRGGLRINVEQQTGMCVECRSVWSEDWHDLVLHIRVENDLVTTAREEAKS